MLQLRTLFEVLWLGRDVEEQSQLVDTMDLINTGCIILKANLRTIDRDLER
jgi:hypothetical protein